MNEVYLVMFRNRIELKQGLCEVGDRFAHDEEYFPKILLTSNLCSQANLFSPTRI